MLTKYLTAEHLFLTSFLNPWEDILGEAGKGLDRFIKTGGECVFVVSGRLCYANGFKRPGQ